jgi:hypothetical protein
MTSLEEDFRTFLSLRASENSRLRKHLRAYGAKSWKSFTPKVKFDLLYLPDTLQRGTLAASYLPYFNVELRSGDDVDHHRLRKKHRGLMPRVVQLVGSSSWLHPNLSASGGSTVDGALLISTCPGGHGLDLSDSVQRFEARFLAKAGRAPGLAAKQAFDAATLMVRAQKWARSRRNKRVDVARFLRRAQLRDGLCGTLDVNSQGQVEGQIEVFRVERGNPEIFEY